MYLEKEWNRVLRHFLKVFENINNNVTKEANIK